MERRNSTIANGHDHDERHHVLSSFYKKRRGMVTVESLLIFGSFALATYAFFFLGKAVIAAYFGDGNHYTAIPLF